MASGLGIHVREDFEEPIYQQIYDQVVDRVKSGTWPEGFRLPPTRALASELGTHRNTVVRAFEELATAGFLVSTVGRGTFVAAQPKGVNGPAVGQRNELPWASLLTRRSELELVARLERYRREEAPRAAIDMTRMQPSDDLLPHAMMRRCLDHVLRTHGPRALGYAPREGVWSLREQIAVELAQRGVPARAEEIIITTGSQQALDMLARALVDPGDRFLVDGTSYTGALNVLALAGAQVRAVPSDAEGPDPSWLRRLSRGEVKGIYLMPNCHNPTGATISAERRRALIAWSHEIGAPIVEDDYGAELDLDGEPCPPYMRALDPEVLYVSTFSKRLMPALRIGYVVAPAALRERLVGLKHALDLGTSPLLQYALAEMLERGHLRAHYARVLPEYRMRRDALAHALERHLPSDITWELPKRGVVLWLRLPPEIEAEDLYRAGRREGVLVSPSTLNSADGRAVGGVRLIFCHEPADRLIEGAKRLGRAVRSLLAGRKRRAKHATAIEGV
jgi:GntR family transcriptional regulator/MocR family aminotransferase